MKKVIFTVAIACVLGAFVSCGGNAGVIGECDSIDTIDSVGIVDTVVIDSIGVDTLGE